MAIKNSKEKLSENSRRFLNMAVEINSKPYDETKDNYNFPETNKGNSSVNELERKFPFWLRTIVLYFDKKYKNSVCNTLDEVDEVFSYLKQDRLRTDYRKKVLVRENTLSNEEVLSLGRVPGTCLRSPCHVRDGFPPKNYKKRKK